MLAVPGVAGRAVTAGRPCGQVLVRSERTSAQAGAVAGVAPGESDLAVLVLQVSWALADAAHDLPAGRLSGRRRVELADTLQALGFVLRVTGPDGASR